MSNQPSPVNVNLQVSSQFLEVEVEAYIDLAKYADAFVYGNPDEDVSHFYYHRIPYLIDDKYAYESIFGDVKPTSFSSFNIHEEKKLPPCMTLADGSAIPLIEGDFLIPIVLKGSSNPLEYNSCIYLPSFFVRGFKGESVALKYGDQLINLSFKDFDPEFKRIKWENLTNGDLIKSMENHLYRMRPAHASHPISLKNITVPFEKLKESLKRYLPPSEVLKKQEQAQLNTNILQNICQLERNVIHTIPIEVYFPVAKFIDGKVSLKTERPLVSLKYKEHAVFDLDEKMKEFAGKEIKIQRLGSNEIDSPRIDQNGLGIYINPRYTKNSCLSISNQDLILWQEHKSKEEIEAEGKNETLRKYDRPDVTITYVPISVFGDLNTEDIIERVQAGKYENGLFYISLEKESLLSSTEIEKEVLDSSSETLTLQ